MPNNQNMNQLDNLAEIVMLQQEVATSDLVLNDLMNMICEKTQKLTNAAGAVVELAEGDDMVYKSCTGTLAASLGVRLKVATSLSGMSVRTGEVLHCEDAYTDPRVDRDACIRVGAISMICVPLLHHKMPIGVLKVVSPERNFFGEKEVVVLRSIAGLLSASIGQAEAHNLLMNNERLFRSLYEAAYDAIVMSEDGVITDVNPAFRTLFGYQPNEIVGRPVFDIVGSSSRDDVTRNLKNGYEKPYEVILVKKDGTEFLAEGIGKSLTIQDRKLRVTTIRDITLKKMTEETLKESAQKSQEATNAKSEFLANMSHEIRTPLNGVMGMAGILADTELDPQQKEYVELIRSSADSLLILVNDILDFSKIEAKKLVLENISFELSQAVEDIRQLLSFSANKKGIEFHIKIDSDVPKRVMGDPTRIRQVILNLASNAIKFTSSGSVTIQMKLLNKEDGKALIKFEVIDTGIGISSKALTGMFQPFTQVDASTTRKFGGTGLGLSICKQLVELMGGKIGASSSEGRGSNFWFSIAMPVVSDSPSAKPVDVKPMANLEKLRILVAEDNSVNAMIVRTMLTKLGHSTTLVSNGKEAIDALALAPYDLVLMDCQMPEMDGYEATQYIRSTASNFKDIAIIAMTANAMSGDKEKCLSIGMNDYVSKPMKAEDLAAVLQKFQSGIAAT